MKLFFCSRLTMVAIAGVFAGTVHADSVRWVGGDGSWTNASKWQSGVVPSAADNLAGVNGGNLTVDTPGAVLGSGENASIDGGMLSVVTNGSLAVGSNFEIGRHNTATLIVDGGTMTIGGTTFNGHYTDATSLIDVKNGGSLSVSSFRNDGADSTIRLSGAGSSITSLSGNNSFANNDASRNKLELSDGTLTTPGRDYWGGTVDFDISGGLYDANGDQLYLGSRVGSQVDISLSGGTIDTAGNVYFLNSANSTGAIVQTAGTFRLNSSARDFNLANGADTEGSYEISGGLLEVGRNLNMHSGNEAVFRVVGDAADIQIGSTLNAGNAQAALEYIFDEDGVSSISVDGTASIGGSALTVDVSAYAGSRTNGVGWNLIDYGSRSGEFGLVTVIGADGDDWNLEYDAVSGSAVTFLFGEAVTNDPPVTNIVDTGPRIMNPAPAPGIHPRVYFDDADKAGILARRVSSDYWNSVGSAVRNSLVNNTITSGLTTEDLSDTNSPNWTAVEQYFGVNDGRNQGWGVTAYEAWLVDDAGMKGTVITQIVNYAQILLFTKDLYDGVYSYSGSSGFHSDVNLMWDTSSWTVSQQWISGGAGFALAYDLMFNDMTTEQQDVVREAIVTATTGRISYGMDMPKGRGASNHYGYHGELAVLLCAIKGESGFDQTTFDRIRQVLLDYWEVGFTPEGYCGEDSYGHNLGMREGSRGLIALARNDTNDNIFVTQKFKNYCNAIAYQIEPRPNGWLTGGASGADSGNHPGSNQQLYEGSLIVAKYMRPTDPAMDYNWRWILGENFGNTHKFAQCGMDFVLWGLDINSGFSTPNTLADAELELTDFSPRRGKLITRSDWSQDASYFILDARPDAFQIGHDKVDRGVFHFSALGRAWTENPKWNIWKYGQYQSLVQIDGISQAYKAPSVKFLEHEDLGTHVTGASDLKYAYDWEWTPPWPSSTSSYSAPWEPETTSTADLGYPTPLPYWMPAQIYDSPDVGYVGSYMQRKAYNGVERAFRSFLFNRDEKPFVIIADDIQKDNNARAYRWQMSVAPDVSIISQSGRDIILGRTAEPNGPKLLVRVLEANDASGLTPATLTGSIIVNAGTPVNQVLHIDVNSVAPQFKIMLFPFNDGDVLPATSFAGDVLSVDLGGETIKLISFAPDAAGRSIVSLVDQLPAFRAEPRIVSSSGDEEGPIAPLQHQFMVINNDSNSISWSVSDDQAWLGLDVSGGTVPMFGTNIVNATIVPQPGWTAGSDYTATLSFVSATHTQETSVVVSIRPGALPAEEFTGAGDAFDLDNKQITLVPYGDGYSVSVVSISELPVSISGATQWTSPGDDTFWTQTPAWSNDPQFYGASIPSVHIGSNGQITFEAGSSSWEESVAGHFAQRMVSLLWRDLSPNSGGTVHFEHVSGDRVAITFSAVPVYGNNSLVNTAQLEIFDDGSDIVRLSYLQVDTENAMVGLSSGSAAEWPDQEMDFSAQPAMDAYTQWAVQYGVAGLDVSADPDGNGLPLLIEYALHGIPEGAEGAYHLDASLPGVALDQAPPLGVVLDVEWTSDLQEAWQTGGVVRGESMFTIPDATNSSLFIRLKASK